MMKAQPLQKRMKTIWKRAIDMDTMLDDYDPIIPQPDEPLVPQELTFAPGEGQVPLSVFQDENAEYLAFPTIYCGQKRPDNSESS